MSANPYRELGDHHFWRRSVAGVERFLLDPVRSTRFKIGRAQRVATAGSCFAQHISNRLSRIGFNYYLAEDGRDVPESERSRNNYGVFSARYGNIYTSRQLVQMFQECFEGRDVSEGVWQRPDGRYVDALRPQVTPDGFATPEEVRAERKTHVEAVARMFQECEVFVFTMGLTECWRSRVDGTAYPLAPGVAGGEYDPDRHEFVNLNIHDVLEDMRIFFEGLKRVNPDVKVVLTVSPVPLIATYEDQHVLVATTYSKSVLRVAADMLVREHDWIDYFPSYEIITGNYNNSVYFEADYRSVNSLGVDHAMRCFLKHYTTNSGPDQTSARAVVVTAAAEEVVCDEEAIDQINV